ncbi:MAG: PadR family transcriptional regulator [Anaerolinea sp.]|nr:PadR family transcriptional regulator [Anaerolinea sp.]
MCSSRQTGFLCQKGCHVVDQTALTKKLQKEMNAGIASLVLLSVLGQAKEPMYGYQIAKLLDDNSESTPLMKQGALYPVLRSLESSGLLESQVEPSVSGPPRRYYQITSAGRETLVVWRGIWDQMKSFVDNAIRGESE